MRPAPMRPSDGGETACGLWPDAGDVVIDALFGAGLSRAVPPEVGKRDADGRASQDLPVIAVDLPSGVDGRSGQVLGASFQAASYGHVHDPQARPSADAGADALRHAGGVRHRHPRAHPARSCRHAWRKRPASLAANTRSPWTLPRTNSNAGILRFFRAARFQPGAARLSAMAGLRAGAGLGDDRLARRGLASQCVSSDGRDVEADRGRRRSVALADRQTLQRLRPRPGIWRSGRRRASSP